MKKILSLLMAFVFCFATMTPALAATQNTGAIREIPVTAPEKLGAVERYFYGTEQSGTIATRLDILETDIMGQTSSGALLGRVDNLYNYVTGKPADGGLTFATKLNAVEWQFADRMDVGPAKTRIENLEGIIGTTAPTALAPKKEAASEGTNETVQVPAKASTSLTSRVDNMIIAAFPEGSLESSAAVVPKDAVIKVQFLQDISSNVNNRGEEIDFMVANNVYVGTTLVIPKGAKGYGTIRKITPPRSFGRDAKIDLDFSHVIAIDGSPVPVYVGELAKQEAKTAAGAAGASIGGLIVLGPVGVVGGAFVTGKSVSIPTGSFTFVQVKTDTDVNGFIQPGAKIIGSQAVAITEEEKKEE